MEVVKCPFPIAPALLEFFFNEHREVTLGFASRKWPVDACLLFTRRLPWIAWLLFCGCSPLARDTEERGGQLDFFLKKNKIYIVRDVKKLGFLFVCFLFKKSSWPGHAASWLSLLFNHLWFLRQGVNLQPKWVESLRASCLYLSMGDRALCHVAFQLPRKVGVIRLKSRLAWSRFTNLRCCVLRWWGSLSDFSGSHSCQQC